MFEKLLEDTSFWSGEGQLSDTVLSTRLRIVRNQADIPFGPNQSDDDTRKIENPVTEYISSMAQDGLVMMHIRDIEPLDRRFLRERNIIPESAENSTAASLVYMPGSRFTMTVNAADHYKFQVIRPGLALYECYGEIVDADDELNRYVPYAFSEVYGYLTSSIDHTGTGLRASVLMHLPVCAIMGTIPEIKRMVSEIGGSMEPVTRNGNRNYGSFYLVSNSESIGRSESDLLEVVDDASRMVAGLETESRDDYFMNFTGQLEDRIWRAYGILTHARSISYTEALEHLSSIRLGVILSVIKDIPLRLVNDLFVKIQPAHLSKISGHASDAQAGYDMLRSDFLRTRISGKEVQSA